MRNNESHWSGLTIMQLLTVTRMMNQCMYACRGIASSKHVRGPQLNNNIMLTIANVNQDIDSIDSILKQDKSEGAMAPLAPL